MRNNEETKEQDEKILSLPVNVLTNFLNDGDVKIKKVQKFFKAAYVELSMHELFNEDYYRQKWLENIDSLEALAHPFKGYSKEEVQLAIETGCLILNDNLKETLSKYAGKEVKDDSSKA